MIIALLGYMGSGKSSIGKHLASKLGFNFIDLDSFIEEKEKLTIQELFKKKGEIYFRKIEHEYLKEIYRTKNNIILSLGGGTPCFYGNMEVINSQKSIYLKLLPKTLGERLFHKRFKRPLISHLNNKESLTEFVAIHLFERQNFYNKATITLKTDELTIDQTVQEIIKILN